MKIQIDGYGRKKMYLDSRRLLILFIWKITDKHFLFTGNNTKAMEAILTGCLDVSSAFQAHRQEVPAVAPGSFRLWSQDGWYVFFVSVGIGKHFSSLTVIRMFMKISNYSVNLLKKKKNSKTTPRIHKRLNWGTNFWLQTSNSS